MKLRGAWTAAQKLREVTDVLAVEHTAALFVVVQMSHSTPATGPVLGQFRPVFFHQSPFASGLSHSWHGETAYAGATAAASCVIAARQHSSSAGAAWSEAMASAAPPLATPDGFVCFRVSPGVFGRKSPSSELMNTRIITRRSRSKIDDERPNMVKANNVGLYM